MAKDVNLLMRAASSPLTTSGSTTAIDTEGGFFAAVRCYGGTITDADETFALVVEASVNNGSNYYPVGAFPTIVATDDNIEIARVVYVPKPSLATATKTKVRITWVAAGTTPSWPVAIYLEPLVSLAPPAVDEDLGSGLANLT